MMTPFCVINNYYGIRKFLLNITKMSKFLQKIGKMASICVFKNYFGIREFLLNITKTGRTV